MRTKEEEEALFAFLSRREKDINWPREEWDYTEWDEALEEFKNERFNMGLL